MSMKRKTLIFKDFGHMFTIFVEQAFSEYNFLRASFTDCL